MSSVQLLVVRQKYGSIMLNVKAVTLVAGDAVRQPLRVKPEGQGLLLSTLLSSLSSTEFLSVSVPSLITIGSALIDPVGTLLIAATWNNN